MSTPVPRSHCADAARCCARPWLPVDQEIPGGMVVNQHGQCVNLCNRLRQCLARQLSLIRRISSLLTQVPCCLPFGCSLSWRHGWPLAELDLLELCRDRKSTRLNSSHLVISY